MPGPLPNANKRRRNAPTIETQELDPRGRRGKPPVCPMEIGCHGRAWWEWAWRLPQATRWDVGSHYFVARRAQLEDRHAEGFNGAVVKEMRELENRLGLNPKAMRELRWSIAEEGVVGPELAVVKPLPVELKDVV